MWICGKCHGSFDLHFLFEHIKECLDIHEGRCPYPGCGRITKTHRGIYNHYRGHNAGYLSRLDVDTHTAEYHQFCSVVRIFTTPNQLEPVQFTLQGFVFYKNTNGVIDNMLHNQSTTKMDTMEDVNVGEIKQNQVAMTIEEAMYEQHPDCHGDFTVFQNRDGTYTGFICNICGKKWKVE